MLLEIEMKGSLVSFARREQRTKGEYGWGLGKNILRVLEVVSELKGMKK